MIDWNMHTPPLPLYLWECNTLEFLDILDELAVICLLCLYLCSTVRCMYVLVCFHSRLNLAAINLEIMELLSPVNEVFMRAAIGKSFGILLLAKLRLQSYVQLGRFHMVSHLLWRDGVLILERAVYTNLTFPLFFLQKHLKVELNQQFIHYYLAL